MESQRSTKRYSRVSLADAQKEFLQRGLTLLAKQYLNISTPMPYRCNTCGFSPQEGKGLRLNDLRRKGVGCRRCAINRRAAGRAHSIDHVRDALAAVGIILLSKTYKSVDTELRVRCAKCGHPWRATFHALNPEQPDPTGCPPCSVKRRADKRRHETEFVKSELKKLGIILRSEYRNSNEPIVVEYEECGHTDPNKSWNAILQGGRCGRCAKNARATDEDYAALARQFDGTLVRKAVNASRESDWICPIGHPFKRSFSTIKAEQTFCNICTGSYSEILCRMLVESLFEVPFHRVRVKEMRSRKGTPLELDMFNSELRIAVEHNGPHHYGPVGNWGGEAAFEAQKDNDSRRRDYCKKSGIFLIEIRQLGQKTTLEQAKAQIRRALIDAGMPLPQNFETADLSKLAPKSETQAYWEMVQKAAANLGLKILPCVYEGADTPIPAECQLGHVIPKTPRSILQGHKCDECNSLRLRKAVRLSDGREFKSGADAAKALGVTKETVNRAAVAGWQVKGFYVQRTDSNRSSSRVRTKS
jgi:hypothetical protein